MTRVFGSTGHATPLLGMEVKGEALDAREGHCGERKPVALSVFCRRFFHSQRSVSPNPSTTHRPNHLRENVADIDFQS